MKTRTPPVLLRFYTGGLQIVSEDWWNRFLRSQLKSMEQKRLLTSTGTKGVVSPLERGSSTNGKVESIPQQDGRGNSARQHAV